MVPADLVDRIAAELARVHTIERGGLMKANIGVSRIPVAARLMITIDDDETGIALGGNRVGERHAHGAGAYHQIVGLDRRHGVSLWRCTVRRAARTSSTYRPSQDPPLPNGAAI